MSSTDRDMIQVPRFRPGAPIRWHGQEWNSTQDRVKLLDLPGYLVRYVYHDPTHAIIQLDDEREPRTVRSAHLVAQLPGPTHHSVEVAE